MGSLPVRVQARAGRTEVVGPREGVLVVRVKEPPVAGRANEAVRRLVAKELGVPRGKVSVARGARGRDKLLEVAGLATADLRRRLGLDA